MGKMFFKLLLCFVFLQVSFKTGVKQKFKFSTKYPTAFFYMDNIIYMNDTHLYDTVFTKQSIKGLSMSSKYHLYSQYFLYYYVQLLHIFGVSQSVLQKIDPMLFVTNKEKASSHISQIILDGWLYAYRYKPQSMNDDTFLEISSGHLKTYMERTVKSVNFRAVILATLYSEITKKPYEALFEQHQIQINFKEHMKTQNSY